MNQQIRHTLQGVTWEDGSQHKVFRGESVRIIAGAPTEDQVPDATPWPWSPYRALRPMRTNLRS